MMQRKAEPKAFYLFVAKCRCRHPIV